MKKDAVSQTFDLLSSQLAALKQSLRRSLESAIALLDDAENLASNSDRELSARLKSITLEARKLQEISERTKSIEDTARYLSESVKDRKDVFEAFMNNSPIAVYMLDDKSNVAYMNPPCQEFFGVTLNEARGKSALDFMPAKYAEKLKANDAKVMAEDKPIEFVEVIPNLRGEERYWLSAKFPWRDFTGKRFLCGVSLDITEGTKAERALKEKEESFKTQREDFMAALAHDLKTPVLGCDRVLDLLINGSLGEIADEHKDVLLKVQAGNKLLLSRIKDLLDVCRYEALAELLRYQQFKLKPLIDSVISQLHPQSEERRLSFENDVPQSLEIYADQEEIKRLLLNLLDNAVKFSPDKGSISISASAESKHVVVSIQDQGKGISQADQERLFDRFWQGGNSKSYSASIGLGLYLCHKIITAHQGEIVCESTEGKGTKFTFFLPGKLPDPASKKDKDLVA